MRPRRRVAASPHRRPRPHHSANYPRRPHAAPSSHTANKQAMRFRLINAFRVDSFAHIKIGCRNLGAHNSRQRALSMSLLGLIVSDIPHASLLFSTPTICVYYIISLTPNDPHVHIPRSGPLRRMLLCWSGSRQYVAAVHQRSSCRRTLSSQRACSRSVAVPPFRREPPRRAAGCRRRGHQRAVLALRLIRPTRG